jgi:hypothetical protein
MSRVLKEVLTTKSTISPSASTNLLNTSRIDLNPQPLALIPIVGPRFPLNQKADLKRLAEPT